MVHKYQVTGMTCGGCEAKVKSALLKVENVTNVEVSKDENSATLTMDKHIPTTQLQKALTAVGKYTIEMSNNKSPQHTTTNEPVAKSCCSAHSHDDKKIIEVTSNIKGKYYCPMHCEGDKTYDKAGDCPVCGMHLVKEAELNVKKTMYTCPMHPEVIQDSPGSCPICGMDLVPMEPSDSEEKKTYLDLLNKLYIASLFTVPIFFFSIL